jgi:hypothetical protein
VIVLMIIRRQHEGRAQTAYPGGVEGGMTDLPLVLIAAQVAVGVAVVVLLWAVRK